MFAARRPESFEAYGRGIQLTHRQVGTGEARWCERCGVDTRWPCPTARWQEQWLATLNLPPEDGADD